MKIKLVLLSLLFLPIIAFSQPKLKKKKKINSKQGTKEIYHVLESNKKVKHGKYEKKIGFRLVEEGYYNNGKKQIFSFYDYNSKLMFKYDFENDTLLDHKINSKWLSYKDNKLNVVTFERPAFPLISEVEVELFIGYNIEYPYEAMENGIQGVVEIGFYVDSIGNISNYQLVLGIHPLLNDASLKVIKSLPQTWRWFPAIKNGKAIKSFVVIPITFLLN